MTATHFLLNVLVTAAIITQCIITHPCPEGPKTGSYCRWVPFDQIRGKQNTEEHHDSGENENRNKENQKHQVAGPFPLPHPLPYPLPHPLPHPLPPFQLGYCTCCVITACDPPMKFNCATYRCECPRGTRKNTRGQCVRE